MNKERRWRDERQTNDTYKVASEATGSGDGGKREKKAKTEERRRQYIYQKLPKREKEDYKATAAEKCVQQLEN